MKKKVSRADQDDLRPEYDLRSLRVLARGPGRKTPKRNGRTRPASHRVAGMSVVVLDPDVAAEFRTPKDVNDSLRPLATILRERQKRRNRKSG